MSRLPSAFHVLLLTCLLMGCGGGGGPDAPSIAAATVTPDLTSGYAGQWKLTCYVSIPARQDPSYPEGLSGDEIVTITKINETLYTLVRSESLYNNTNCSTSTSYFVGAEVTSTAEIVGRKGTRTPGVQDVHKVIYQRHMAGVVVQALTQLDGVSMYITRSDRVGIALDAEGYPAALDTTQQFTRTF